MSETTEKTPDAPEAAAEGAGTAAEASPPSSERAPFALKRGARVEYGHRKGTVSMLRGGGPTPYEACIRWDGEKYPQWNIYASLEMAYENGELKVL